MAQQRARAQLEQVVAAREGAEGVQDGDGVQSGAVMMKLALVAPLSLAVDSKVLRGRSHKPCGAWGGGKVICRQRSGEGAGGGGGQGFEPRRVVWHGGITQ